MGQLDEAICAAGSDPSQRQRCSAARLFSFLRAMPTTAMGPGVAIAPLPAVKNGRRQACQRAPMLDGGDGLRRRTVLS